MKTVHKIEKWCELRWTSNALFISSVSPYYTNKIASFTGKKGHTVFNGYTLPDNREYPEKQNEEFTIVYNGSLYDTQPIEEFIETFIEFKKEHPEIRFRLKFPGLAFDKSQEARVKKSASEILDIVDTFPRIPKKEVIEMQRKADLLLLMSHRGIKGVSSSKVFEYMALKRPVLLYPNDRDIQEEIISGSGVGTVADDKQAVKDYLEKLVETFKKEGRTTCIPNEKYIDQFSHKNQSINFIQLIQKESHGA